MNEEKKIEDEEISLIDLLAVLLQRKWLVIGITLGGAIFSIIISILSLSLPAEKSFLPNNYTSSAQMLINNSDKSTSSLSNLSSLASIAGVNINSSGGISYSELAKYLVDSNTVQDSVIKKFNFIEEWKIEKSPVTESRSALKKKLKSDFSEDSGVFTVSFTDINAKLAQDVVNYVVELLEIRFKDLGINKNEVQKTNLEENINNTYNQIVLLQKQIQDIEKTVNNVYSPYNTPSIVMDAELVKTELAVQEEVYKQLKIQYETLKVEMSSEQPIFQILEYAEIPDKKSGPSRGKLCIIITFAAFFISVFIAFLLNAVSNIKKDSEAMAKLRGNTNV